MINKTDYFVSISSIPQDVAFNDEKIYLNAPTGDFFYDPWKIKDEYKNTYWDDVLQTLDFEIGEARIIKLSVGECYLQHADIDDRYHLNITGDNSILINLENYEIFKIFKDGIWYEMDAGIIHSAVNFGQEDRYQLVVRKLLKKNLNYKT